MAGKKVLSIELRKCFIREPRFWQVSGVRRGNGDDFDESKRVGVMQEASGCLFRDEFRFVFLVDNEFVEIQNSIVTLRHLFFHFLAALMRLLAAATMLAGMSHIVLLVGIVGRCVLKLWVVGVELDELFDELMKELSHDELLHERIIVVIISKLLQKSLHIKMSLQIIDAVVRFGVVILVNPTIPPTMTATRVKILIIFTFAFILIVIIPTIAECVLGIAHIAVLVQIILPILARQN